MEDNPWEGQTPVTASAPPTEENILAFPDEAETENVQGEVASTTPEATIQDEPQTTTPEMVRLFGFRSVKYFEPSCVLTLQRPSEQVLSVNMLAVKFVTMSSCVSHCPSRSLSAKMNKRGVSFSITLSFEFHSTTRFGELYLDRGQLP